MLGGVFLWLCIRLYRRADRRSAAILFHYSLAYLALLFCAMAIDKRRCSRARIPRLMDRKLARKNIVTGLVAAAAGR